MKITLMITEWDQEKSEFYGAFLGCIDVSRSHLELLIDDTTAYNVQYLFDNAKPKLPLHWVSAQLWAKSFARNFQHVNTYAVIDGNS